MTPTDHEQRDEAYSADGEHSTRAAGRSMEPGRRAGPAAGESGTTDLRRRDYLKAVGAATVAGSLAGASTGTAAAQEDWEAEADARIEEHRTSDFDVQVQDQDGNPIPDAEVEVEMQEHEFNFGTAVDAEQLLSASDDDPYVEHLEDLFNTAVLENHHKWRFWVENRETADQATEWLDEHGFRIRGHACVWGDRSAYAIPAEIETAIDNRDAETVRQESLDHIEEIISYYGDTIEEWDVVNEVLHALDLMVGYYGDDIDQENQWEGDVIPWTSDLLLEWYQKAEEVAAEYDVDIAVNDYNTLNGWGYTTDWYPTQIEFLTEENDVDLDAIGFQGHIEANDGEPFTDDGPDERLSYEDINELLSIYEEYDAELKVTEFDAFQGDLWESDEEKADVLRRYLKALYGHPDATAFLLWGYWDGAHWSRDFQGEADAPLFYEDWSPKPAYDVWDGLINEEWWTEEAGTTDDAGTFSTSAYLGEHEVTVTTSQETVSESFSVTDPDGTTEVVVTAEGDAREDTGCGGNEDAESIQVDGDTVCNVDGDEYYRDVNGDGTVGNRDVGAFFENFHFDAFDRDEFDYSGNGRVSHGDVVALFNYV